MDGAPTNVVLPYGAHKNPDGRNIVYLDGHLAFGLSAQVDDATRTNVNSTLFSIGM
jgi:prepilin-type processing-associated H-X9-DG protein